MGPAPAVVHLEYEVVDVFTDRAFTGNPLAVVLGADDLSGAQLQALAREFHLSETAFPMTAADGADYRLRIFTPTVELPFAGHPSVGAAWVLAARGELAYGPVVQSCGAGLLELVVDGHGATLRGAAPSVGAAREPAALLAGLGLSADDLDGEVRDASAGLGFTVVPVAGGAVSRLRPDLGALRSLDLGAGRPYGGVCVVHLDATVARCRVLAFAAGVDEDPATGSAALALGAYLVATGRVPADATTAYEVVQGVEMGRPSRLSCTVTAAAGAAVACTVRGQVVPVASGRIRVPT